MQVSVDIFIENGSNMRLGPFFMAVKNYRIPFLGAILALLFALPSAGYAEAAEDRIVFDKTTESFALFEECSAVDGIITMTYDGFLVTSSDAQGGFHSTKVRVGNFTFVLASGVIYTGQFFDQYSVYNNRLTDPDRAITEVTLMLMGTGSDGSVLNFRSIQHEVMNRTGFSHTVEYLWCKGLLISG